MIIAVSGSIHLSIRRAVARCGSSWWTQNALAAGLCDFQYSRLDPQFRIQATRESVLEAASNGMTAYEFIIPAGMSSGHHFFFVVSSEEEIVGRLAVVETMLG